MPRRDPNSPPAVGTHKMRTRARTRNNPQFRLISLSPTRRPRPVVPTPHPHVRFARRFQGDPGMPLLSLGAPAVSREDQVLDDQGVDPAKETHFGTNVGTGGHRILYHVSDEQIDRELEEQERRRKERKLGERRAKQGWKKRKAKKGGAQKERDDRGRFLRKEEVVEEGEVVDLEEGKKGVKRTWSTVLRKWIEEKGLYSGEERWEHEREGYGEGEVLMEWHARREPMGELGGVEREFRWREFVPGAHGEEREETEEPEASAVPVERRPEQSTAWDYERIAREEAEHEDEMMDQQDLDELDDYDASPRR